MIIAAHVPIHPQQTLDPTSGNYPLFVSPPSVVSDTQLLSTLHNYSNLILWIAGHRHINVVTPQAAPTGSGAGQGPEYSFWEVETASLRDFPQQFRTFEILRNSDDSISIFVTDVDPADEDHYSQPGSAVVLTGNSQQTHDSGNERERVGGAAGDVKRRLEGLEKPAVDRFAVGEHAA